MQKIFVDRSRIEQMQRCPRRRFLEYHEGAGGMGIAPVKKALPLAVGGSVHVGLETLLREGQEWITNAIAVIPDNILLQIEEHAVAAALADFALHSGALELDATEAAALIETEETRRQRDELRAQARELGMSEEGLGLEREQAMGQFDQWLYAEQSALVEGLVRAYCRRKLRPLLEEFEVLEVEREGEWKLSEWGQAKGSCRLCGVMNVPVFHAKGSTGICCEPCGKVNGWTLESEGVEAELWFMSRPDALLRERRTNELYLLSFKTTAGWDVRRAKSAERDMQGLSEGVEVERRLGEWWRQVNAPGSFKDALGFNIPTPMYIYLKGMSAPPRIHAIRYEYLLKGERWEDKELSAKLGMTVRTQRSHLIRQYVAVSTPKKGDGGYRVGDVCWSWDFSRPEDSSNSKLAWQNWKGQGVWEGMEVKDWIDMLDQSELLMSGEDSTVGMEPRALGWRSAAQAMGVTSEHPLDSVFLPPVVIYRNDDELRDWIEQVEAQERGVAEDVGKVMAAGDAGERHSLLNQLFPQYRSSCFYPSQCQFAGTVCWAANQDAEANPMGTGKFKQRVANHPQEVER
jgi:hypothetical protein